MSEKVRDLYIRTLRRLKEAGIEDAVSDTRILLSDLLGTDFAGLFLQGEQDVPAPLLDKLERNVQKRLRHIPVQYITGETCFMGYTFSCREGVLIPRFDTEILVEQALKYGEPGNIHRILDLCCGTGCIGISFYKEMQKRKLPVQVVCGDISPAAVALARKNAENLKSADGVRVVQSDLFENLRDGTFDMILSNPPYIPSGEIPGLMPEVNEYEPRLALDGGKDGLALYRQIGMEAPAHLAAGGILAVEIGYNQKKDVQEIFRKCHFREIQCFKDLNGLDRVVAGIYDGTGSGPEKGYIDGGKTKGD